MTTKDPNGYHSTSNARADSKDKQTKNLISNVTSQLQSRWQSVVTGIPFFWLLLFFLAPFFIVLKISLAESLIASPPFSNLLQWNDSGFPSIKAFRLP